MFKLIFDKDLHHSSKLADVTTWQSTAGRAPVEEVSSIKLN